MELSSDDDCKDVRDAQIALKDVAESGSIPWEAADRPSHPNPLTRTTIENAEAGKDIVRCADADDLFRKLGL